jgi:predicted NAD-dependent protein-ADP-ribosyltransferase YbiA (DUF1768 family)
MTQTSEKAKLLFSFKGAKKPPGFSSSKFEFVPDRKAERWNELKSIPEWRRVLSSLYVHPLKIGDKTFNTGEHYLQYCKIRIADEKKAEEFTLESKSKLGLGDGKTASKARKIVKLSEEQFKLWENVEKRKAKSDLLKAKFGEGTLGRKILLATCDAELWHHAPRRSHVRMFKHEELREEIRKSLDRQ